MGLVGCSECGATVSTFAKSCPGCGCDFVEKQRHVQNDLQYRTQQRVRHRRRRGRWVQIGLLVLASMVVGILLTSCISHFLH